MFTKLLRPVSPAPVHVAAVDGALFEALAPLVQAEPFPADAVKALLTQHQDNAFSLYGQEYSSALPTGDARTHLFQNPTRATDAGMVLTMTDRHGILTAMADKNHDTVILHGSSLLWLRGENYMVFGDTATVRGVVWSDDAQAGPFFAHQKLHASHTKHQCSHFHAPAPKP